MSRAWLVLCLGLLPASAGAVPFDIADPTPRGIDVEIEISADLSVVGQRYRPPARGAWTSEAGIGRAVVPGANLEALYDGFFQPIPGSFTNFVIEIDLATREAVVLPFSMTFFHSNGNFSFHTSSLETTATGGFIFSTVFCTQPSTPFGPCSFVPGAPYDPTTGTLNAIGPYSVPFDPEGGGPVPDQFSGDGDLRLSEVPEPRTTLLWLVGLGLAWRAGRQERAASNRAASWSSSA